MICFNCIIAILRIQKLHRKYKNLLNPVSFKYIKGEEMIATVTGDAHQIGIGNKTHRNI